MIQGSPQIVLTCAECKETSPIGGTRRVHPDLPDEPLCPEDFALAVRFASRLTEDNLIPLGPLSETNADGTVWLRRMCPRCGGAGKVENFRGTCFMCLGARWTYVNPKGVQRIMRWSATFQANRIPKGV